MRILLAAPHSGSGKTTITLALLAALRQRGLRVGSFKVGPDYIDPMFHRAATGSECRNLDPFLTSEDYVQRCFGHHGRQAEAVVVEGVMGLFDGLAGSPDFASTAHVARLLDLPVVLVIDVAKMGQSVAAILYGLVHYDPRLSIAGVIFNRVGSERHAQIVRQAAAAVAVPVLGLVRHAADVTLPSRHLGLVPVEELAGFEQVLARLAQLAEDSFDWGRLLSLTCPLPHGSLWDIPPLAASARIGVAEDVAFNFRYADNLDLLRHLGATIWPFSPLQTGLPSDCDGILLGGGFPEMFAEPLSEQLRTLPQRLPPIYAECGGLMALGQSLRDLQGRIHPMAAVLPHSTEMATRLTLGYRQATALRSSLMVRAGQTVRGHEFHRSRLLAAPDQPLYRWVGSNLDTVEEGCATASVHASYLHLHWGSEPELAKRFLQTCLGFS